MIITGGLHTINSSLILKILSYTSVSPWPLMSQNTQVQKHMILSWKLSLTVFSRGVTAQLGPRPCHSLLRFLDHTQLSIYPAGLLWTSDQLVADRHNTLHIQQTNIHVLSGNQTCEPTNQTGTDICLRPHASGIGFFLMLFFSCAFLYFSFAPTFPFLYAAKDFVRFAFFSLLSYQRGKQTVTENIPLSTPPSPVWHFKSWTSWPVITKFGRNIRLLKPIWKPHF